MRPCRLSAGLVGLRSLEGASCSFVALTLTRRRAQRRLPFMSLHRELGFGAFEGRDVFLCYQVGLSLFHSFFHLW